jgi:hypothetical protein
VRRRPQPSRRRGLLRASAAVIFLIALLSAALLLLSPLTSPTVKAPAIPPTPGPLRPTPIRTVVKAKVTATPRTTRPRRTPVPTATPKGHALGSGTDASPALFKSRPPADVLKRATARFRSRPAFWFEGPGNAYAGRTLRFRLRAGESPRTVGRGDPFVRPVLSADGRYLLYVQVRQVATYPGARWRLIRYDSWNRSIEILARRTAMNLAPLGWSGHQVLFIVANSTDTSIYAVGARGPDFISILDTQPVTSGMLSPDGRWVAFAIPGSCYYCTLNVFDLHDRTTWNGPSGVPGEYAIAWTSDSRWIASPLGDRLALMSADGQDQTLYRLPAALNANWPHPMQAEVRAGLLTITDSTSGRAYTSSRLAGNRYIGPDSF